ncbi:cytochrome P450 [Algiphilus aromaticivorans]|jgi:sterol 14-demethylase|uniref:cytochrome P450 n=1 Tax=Algiphilus aromaticivorans TaxID=382454 RepID=UPI000A7E85C6|nr:cytochrome P450 [Algiphilus aromaticivorans]
MATHTMTQPRGGGPNPPSHPGGLPWAGHLISFVRNPFHFVSDVARRGGEIASFRLLGQRVVLLTGDEASEVFYRGSDEQLDQSAAYKLMTPVFGEGVIFDAPIERKNEQLRMLMPTLRAEAMRNHSTKVVQEVEELIANWEKAGEIELVAFMKQLTINTASHCLLGREFRYELNEEFAEIYHDLEQGVHPVAYHFPNLPIPRFRRRDRARKRLKQLVGDIVRRRAEQSDKPDDMFQSLIDMRYADGTALSEDEITGMLIGAIFAGHHTSSGTAAWMLLELLKHPHILKQAREEVDELLGAEGEITYQNMREMHVLDCVLKEVLRLHPPLIILMRQVNEDLNFKGYTIRSGDMVWASPPVTHRMSSLFPNPEVFDPDRFGEGRREDKNIMAYQPFGGGKHKCSGNAFAMFQIKAIFAVLLRRYDFELVDRPESYVDDYSEMIVQPEEPCRVRYRRRDPGSFATRYGTAGAPEAIPDAAAAGCPVHTAHTAQEAPASAARSLRVTVDRDLCQGHAVCMGESPAHFQVGADGVLHIVKEAVDPGDKAKVDQAVELCPTQALKLVEE